MELSLSYYYWIIEPLIVVVAEERFGTSPALMVSELGTFVSLR